MTDVYYDNISLIVTDYAKKYQEDPGFMKSLFEKYQSPVSVMAEFYRKMVATNEMEPIEDCDKKGDYWNQALQLNCDRTKRIKIAKALYCLDQIVK